MPLFKVWWGVSFEDRLEVVVHNNSHGTSTTSRASCVLQSLHPWKTRGLVPRVNHLDVGTFDAELHFTICSNLIASACTFMPIDNHDSVSLTTCLWVKNQTKTPLLILISNWWWKKKKPHSVMILFPYYYRSGHNGQNFLFLFCFCKFLDNGYLVNFLLLL